MSPVHPLSFASAPVYPAYTVSRVARIDRASMLPHGS